MGREAAGTGEPVTGIGLVLLSRHAHQCRRATHAGADQTAAGAGAFTTPTPRARTCSESDDQLALWQLVHGARAMRCKGGRAATAEGQQHDQYSRDVDQHSPDELVMP